MSRLRMTKAGPQYDDLENMSLDTINEYGDEQKASDDLPELIDLPPKKTLTKKKSPARTKTVTISSKGRRQVRIHELDPEIIPPNREEFLDPTHSGTKLAIIGKPGCFALGTKVRMFDGSIKSVEDVKVGDQVMGDDSTPRNVLELCRGRATMYRINTENGSSIVVNNKHILSLVSTGTFAHKKGEIMNITLELFLNHPYRDNYLWYYQNEHLPASRITFTKLPVDNYYGFTLDGNHLFVLEDFSVVHNTGKSTMIKSLLYEKSDIFPCAQVYSGTEDSNHAYASFIPSSFIFNKFSVESYTDFVRRQKIAKQYLDNPWSVCIWDDITEDERIFNLPLVKGTYKNGRHWKMLHLLSLQYAMDIKPVIRTNIDGTFILRETLNRNRKVLYENYASAIDDYTDFCSIMDTVTNDYTALYIHNRVQSNNFEDCIFWYKARDDIPRDFKFGCEEFWMSHNQRYNPAYVDPIVA